jgi:hypothetical protein
MSENWKVVASGCFLAAMAGLYGWHVVASRADAQAKEMYMQLTANACDPAICGEDEARRHRLAIVAGAIRNPKDQLEFDCRMAEEKWERSVREAFGGNCLPD